MMCMSCDPKEKPDKMVHVLVRLVIGLAQQVVLNIEQTKSREILMSMPSS